MTTPATRTVRGYHLVAAVSITLAVLGGIKTIKAHTESGPPEPIAAIQGTLPPTDTVPYTGVTQQPTDTVPNTGVAQQPMNTVPNTGSSLPPPPPPELAYAVPTRIEIPAIDVHADVITVGVDPDGTVGTPSLSDAKVAGWYDGSAAPGQIGAAVIDAHVDSAMVKDHRGAFFNLSRAKPGMQIDVARSDGATAVFTIDEIQVAPRAAFPTQKVYALTPYPALRLITCGDGFDKKTHEYLGSVIVYAHLSGERSS